MQIIGFSTTNAHAQVLNPVLFGKQAAAKPTAPVSAPATGKPQSATPEPTAPARSAQSHAAPTAGGGGGAAAATAEMLVSSYSTTVNGTRYSGSVVQSGSEYTASVSSLPGATATGASITAAENNLSVRIDELV